MAKTVLEVTIMVTLGRQNFDRMQKGSFWGAGYVLYTDICANYIVAFTS